MAIVYSRPNITKKLLVSFSDLFKKIKIVSRDGGTYIVPIRMGTREKLFSMAQALDEDRNKYRYALPLMGFALTSMSFDSARAMNQGNTLSSIDRYEQLRMPVPYNFSIELYMLANRAGELFEMIEAIVPQFQQARFYPMIEYKFTDGSSITRNIPVVLESTGFEVKGDLSMEEEQVFSATLPFQMQAYLHNSYLKIDDSRIDSLEEGNHYVVAQKSFGPIQTIDLSYEEYIEGVYQSLLGTVTLSEGTGGTPEETMTGEF